MKKVIISSRLKELRTNLGLTQEQIAQICNVTVQAVSKWECELSYPDIQLLPILADTLHVTLDDLLCGIKPETAGAIPSGTFSDNPHPDDAIPDDGVLRVVQYRGRRLLDKQEYDPKLKIPLLLPGDVSGKYSADIEKDSADSNTTDIKKACKAPAIRIEIWGSASVEGDINGDVTAGAGVNCRDVGGNATAGAGLNCGSIGNNAAAGAGLNCGNIGNNAAAGTGINCGNVEGSANAGADITCSDVGGSVSAGADVNCGDVGGSVSAGADVNCGDVGGRVDIGGDLECKNIAGDVHLGGDLHCESIKGTVTRT